MALQIICGMLTYETSWARDHIRVALIICNENTTMKPWEVKNLSRYQNIPSSKTKMDISCFVLMSSAIRIIYRLNKGGKWMFRGTWKGQILLIKTFLNIRTVRSCRKDAFKI